MRWFEWSCEHEVGHPRSYIVHQLNCPHVHGCCGCCEDPKVQLAELKTIFDCGNVGMGSSPVTFEELEYLRGLSGSVGKD